MPVRNARPPAPGSAKKTDRLKGQITAAPGSASSPTPLRLISTGALILVVMTSVWTALNAGYLWKRASLRINPPSLITTPIKAAEDETLLGLLRQPNRLVIPSLSVDAPIVMVKERGEVAYQQALRDGVAHFPGTAAVGQPGNAYLFGHSSDYPFTPGSYKSVFATLPDIAVGAAIYATDSDGNAYRFRTTGTRVVMPDDLSVLDQGGYENRTLTVQTSFPVGTALRRFIVTAELDASMLVR